METKQNSSSLTLVKPGNCFVQRNASAVVAMTSDDHSRGCMTSQKTVPSGIHGMVRSFIVKKWLLAAGLGLAMAASAQAADTIAIVNMGDLFQQVAQKTGVSATLENEFKGRASELQRQESDLQSKMQRLQRDGSTMKASERSKMEKDIMSQRQAFSQKAQAFEKDRARRSNEERGKLVTRIQSAVKSVAADQKIDLVVDANTVAYNSSDVKDITADVLKQVK
jgi:outer membrane protein